MQSKLILSLWIIGGLLYAGSTVFLANTLLGGSSGDKEKSIKLAAAADAQCEKDRVAAGKTDDTKTAAVDTKEAPEPQKPAQASAKPEAKEPPETDTSAAGQDANEDWQSSDGDPNAYPQAEMPGDGQGEGPWYQDQAGAQPDGPMEEEEWAHVVAGTADMRSEPDLRSPLIYALPSGWQVRVISREPGWVQVQDANSGASGWVEATAIAPGAGPNARPGYGNYPRHPGDPYRRYADEAYPYPPPWQRRAPGPFADFLRRALGGF